MDIKGEGLGLAQLIKVRVNTAALYKSLFIKLSFTMPD